MTSGVGTLPVASFPRPSFRWIAAAWTHIRRLYLFLLPIRFSFFALAAIAFALLSSDQGYDIVAALAEDDPTGKMPPHGGQRFGFVVTIALIALQSWFWSRQLLHVPRANGEPVPADYPRLTVWLPRLIGAAFFAAAMGSLYRVGRNYEIPQPVRTLWIMFALLAVGLAAYLAYVIGRRSIMKISHEATDELTFTQLSRLTRSVLLATGIAAVFFFVWATFFVQSTVLVGSAAIVILSATFWIPAGSLLVYLGMRTRVPVFTALLLWAVAISAFTDNHVVRTMTPAAPVESRPEIGPAFDSWYRRLQRDYGHEREHPVFIVATEGGGIRAAYWTAAVLTSLTDNIPGFSDHLFAISGVSGGSLGAAVYTSLLFTRRDGGYRLEARNIDYELSSGEEGRLRTAAKLVLAQDALAPTLAAMMQPDVAQRFIPGAFLPDRARALEEAWEHAWSRVVADDGVPDRTFSSGFLSMMRGREDHLPSLFLNGTTVETGQRIIASNLRTGALANSIDLFEAIGRDMPVSTAVDNSTRFTYVSPAGTLRRGGTGGRSPLQCEPGSRCEHVVDGGYFENSGAVTASEILSVITARGDAKLRPYIIFISYDVKSPAPIESSLFSNEVLSPLRALLSTREGRGTLAVAELKRRAPWFTFQLTQDTVGGNTTVFPLGWLLADRTRNQIDAQMGDTGPNGERMREIARLLDQPVQIDMLQQQSIRAEKRAAQ
jgi:hypothetical protein